MWSQKQDAILLKRSFHYSVYYSLLWTQCKRNAFLSSKKLSWQYHQRNYKAFVSLCSSLVAIFIPFRTLATSVLLPNVNMSKLTPFIHFLCLLQWTHLIKTSDWHQLLNIFYLTGPLQMFTNDGFDGKGRTLNFLFFFFLNPRFPVFIWL